MSGICEAFVALAELALSLGVPPLSTIDGCWEHQVDARWHVCVNGHNAAVKNSEGVEVHPFTCMVKFNGWPAGAFRPYGGIMAAGDVANEDVFLAALRAATVVHP